MISLIGLALAGVIPVSAERTASTYYSIHVASFKNMAAAKSKRDSLKKISAPVFLKPTEVPGEGRFYRVYLGKFEKKDQAIAYWERLKTAGAVSHFGIHYFDEVFKAAGKQRDDRNENLKKGAGFNTLSARNRFVDNNDGTVTDSKTNLMWLKNGWRLNFLSAVTWWQAVDKCNNFNQGGHNNWRLPSIEEWLSLIDIRNQNPALIEPNPFQNVISHMPYWSNSEFIYGTEKRFNQESSFTYTVILYSGKVNHQNKKDRAFVMPVRLIDSLNFYKKYSRIGKALQVK